MFIDASALGELSTQLLTQQELESLGLTNIQAADLEALQEAETHVSHFFVYDPTIFYLISKPSFHELAAEFPHCVKLALVFGYLNY